MLRDVRVWHGGAIVGEDNEINGITFAGVGNGTVVDHVEVAFSLDDGFEFFGGTVNVKHLSSLFAGDDAFDTDEGYQGKGQFLFAMTGLQGHHGLESDSSSDAAAQPRSRPRWTSVTVLGGGARGRNDALLAMRKGTAGTFANLNLGFAKDVGIAVQACPVGAAFVEDGEGAAADDLSVELPSVVFAGPTAEPLSRRRGLARVRGALHRSCRGRPSRRLRTSTRRASTTTSRSASTPCRRAAARSAPPMWSPRTSPTTTPSSSRCAASAPSARAAGRRQRLKGWSKLDERWQMPPPPPPGAPSSPPAAPPPSEPPLVADDSVPQLPVIVTGGVLLLLLVIAIVCRFKRAHTSATSGSAASGTSPRRSLAVLRASASLPPLDLPAGAPLHRRGDWRVFGQVPHKVPAQAAEARPRRQAPPRRGRAHRARHARGARRGHAAARALTSEAAGLGQTPPPREYVGYADALEYALRANIGLSHAKAREYWIYRGPRQVVLVACALLVVLLVQELINPPTPQSRLASAVASVAGLLSALVMLYYRLPDSIRSGVSRSAHDHYVKSKRRIEKRSSSASLAASMSGSIGVGTGDLVAPKMTTMQSLAMPRTRRATRRRDTTPSCTPKRARASTSRRTSGRSRRSRARRPAPTRRQSSRRWTSSFLSRRPPAETPSKSILRGRLGAGGAIDRRARGHPPARRPPPPPPSRSRASSRSRARRARRTSAPELFEASAPGPGGRRVQRMGSHAVISSEQLSASLDEEAAASSASSSATTRRPSSARRPATRRRRRRRPRRSSRRRSLRRAPRRPLLAPRGRAPRAGGAAQGRARGGAPVGEGRAVRDRRAAGCPPCGLEPRERERMDRPASRVPRARMALPWGFDEIFSL